MRKLETKQDIIQLVMEDEWMMAVLHTAKSLNLPDWWVCAGFVRSKVWDYLHGYTERSPLADVDVIYYDLSNQDEAVEAVRRQLRSLMPDVPWSVKNEARMHLINDIPPYSSAVDAMSKFPEIVTALGLTLDEQNKVLYQRLGESKTCRDFEVRPTPHFAESPELMKRYEERLMKKNWKSRWWKVEIIR